MKKLSILFATLFIVAISLTSCKKADSPNYHNTDTVEVVSDTVTVDSLESEF